MLMMRINANGYQKTKTNNLAISQCENICQEIFLQTYLPDCIIFQMMCDAADSSRISRCLVLAAAKKSTFLNNFSTHYYSILTTKKREKNFRIDEIEMTPVECVQKWHKHERDWDEAKKIKYKFVSFVNNIFILIVH